MPISKVVWVVKAEMGLFKVESLLNGGRFDLPPHMIPIVMLEFQGPQPWLAAGVLSCTNPVAFSTNDVGVAS